MTGVRNECQGVCGVICSRSGLLGAWAYAGPVGDNASRAGLPVGWMKALILGGYGNFGARICRALSADANIELQVAGRNLGQARRVADEREILEDPKILLVIGAPAEQARQEAPAAAGAGAAG